MKVDLLKIQNAVIYSLSSAFYQRKLRPYYNDLTQLHCISDFEKLPFTTKAELRSQDSEQFLCTKFEKVKRIHSSSGTKGIPTITYYSDNDIKVWQNHIIRAFKAADLVPGDVFQTIVGFGLFSGGLGFQLAAETYGMSVIPIGIGNTHRQVEFLKKFKVNCFVTISSYLPIIADYMKQIGIIPERDLSLKAILIGAEPINPKEKNELSIYFGVPVLNVYGMSEIEGPGLGYECIHGQGMHICDDDYYVEIIDPQTGIVLPDGQEGEIVITTLRRECMPLIRFRTGDISKLIFNKCKCCNQYLHKLDYIRHRVDDIIIVKGVNIYPDEIGKIIYDVKNICKYYQLIVDKGDKVTLLLTYKGDENLRLSVEEFIIKEIRQWLYISVYIKWVDIEYFTNSNSKRLLVIDKR